MTVHLRILGPASLAPGQSGRVVVVAETAAKRACNAVRVRFVGEAVVDGERCTLCEQSAVHDVSELAAGETRFELEIRVPESAPPTFGKYPARVSYAVSAEADLPWAFDPAVRREIDVRARVPESIPEDTVTVTARHTTAGKTRRSATMTVTLATNATAGESVRGTLRLTRTNGGVRNITAIVRGALGGGAVVEVTSTPLSRKGDEPFEDGQPYAITIPIPAAGPDGSAWHAPSFDTTELSLSHRVVIVADYLSNGLRAEIPLRVHPERPAVADGGATREERMRSARLASWNGALREVDAGKYTASADPDGRWFELAFGAALTRITGAVTGELGAHLRAHLRWDSLGVGLRVEDAASATFDGVPIRGELGDRCRVAVRTAAQAAALLSDPLRRTLAGFQRVRLDDRGGIVEGGGSLQRRSDVSAFVRLCLALHKSIRVRRKVLPRHPAIVAFEPAFAAFAKRRQATLAPGDLAIDKREPGAIGWSLRPRFAAGAVVGTEVFTDLDDSSTGGALELQPSAHEVAGKRLGQPVSRVGRNLCMSLPVAPDPAAIEALLDSFVDVARALTLGGSRGPYR